MIGRNRPRPKINPPATKLPAPSPVPSVAPRMRIDASKAGADLGGGSKVPVSRRVELRGMVGAGTGVGLGLTGLGLALGLGEGIPRAFGGQGPLGAAINPDEPKKDDPPSAVNQLIGDPFTVLVVGALIIGAIFLLKKK